MAIAGRGWPVLAFGSPHGLPRWWLAAGLEGVFLVAREEFVGSGPMQWLLRQSAHVLVLVLDEHRELPVLTWTVTPDGLRGHAEVCDLDRGRDRRVFTAWADALPASEGLDPAPALDESGVTRLRADRRVGGVPVTLTAAVHPF